MTAMMHRRQGIPLQIDDLSGRRIQRFEGCSGDESDRAGDPYRGTNRGPYLAGKASQRVGTRVSGVALI